MSLKFLLKCKLRFSKSQWGSKFRISNKLSDDAHASWSRPQFGWQGPKALVSRSEDYNLLGSCRDLTPDSQELSLSILCVLSVMKTKGQLFSKVSLQQNLSKEFLWFPAHCNFPATWLHLDQCEVRRMKCGCGARHKICLSHKFMTEEEGASPQTQAATSPMLD